jgi:hypothetical protein
MVKRNLAKVKTEGSTPFFRKIFAQVSRTYLNDT